VADLVIHEMTHATVFLKGDRPGLEQFNEELATFVGREGSLLYLARKYGAGSPELAAARVERSDAEAFSAYLAGTAKELEAVYASAASDGEKRVRKAEIIAARAVQYKADYRRLFKGEAYESFPMERINNAYLDLYRLYEGESALYKDYYDKACGGDMKTFIEAIARIAREAAASHGGEAADPKAAMRRVLAAGAAAPGRD
jgi:predicted aminopeptidase